VFATAATVAGLAATTGRGGGAGIDGVFVTGVFTTGVGAGAGAVGVVFAGEAAVGALIEKLDPDAPKEPELLGVAVGATTAAPAAALFQPGGGSIITMLSHFGHDKICPITDSSVTLSRALQVVQ